MQKRLSKGLKGIKPPRSDTGQKGSPGHQDTSKSGNRAPLDIPEEFKEWSSLFREEDEGEALPEVIE